MPDCPGEYLATPANVRDNSEYIHVYMNDKLRFGSTVTKNRQLGKSGVIAHFAYLSMYNKIELPGLNDSSNNNNWFYSYYYYYFTVISSFLFF